MKTDRFIVVIFTHNKKIGNQSENKERHGITMEAQFLPDSINIESYKDKVIFKKIKDL